MKKLATLFLALSISLLLISCNGDPVEESNADEGSLPSSQISESKPDDLIKPDPNNSENTGVRIEDIKTSLSSNYILSETGDLYSWGRNEQGQLGLDLSFDTYVKEPKKIALPAKVKKLETVAGGFTSAALTENNEIYLWGQNLYNFTGKNSGVVINKPVKVPANIKIRDIALSVTTLSLLSEDGKVYSYGWKYENGPIVAEPSDFSEYAFNELHEEEFPNDCVIKDIAFGSSLACFLDDQGNVYAKGYILNSNIDIGGKEIIKINFPEKISSIYANDYNILALSESGNLYGLGMDGVGIIGYEDYKEYAEPTKIDKIEAPISEVYMESSNIIVKTQDNKYYQWGYNISQGITSENVELVQKPIEIKIADAKKIYPGVFNTCYIDKNNNIYGWGSNYNNLLLDENIASVYEPTEISVGKGIS